MANPSKKLIKFIAVVENGYGNYGMTKPYDSKAALYAELALALGEDGTGLDYGDLDTNRLDELDITCFAVESSWKVEAVANGIKIQET